MKNTSDATTTVAASSFGDPCLEQYWHNAYAQFRERALRYGKSWLWLRPHALLDHIFIKAYRIRTIRERGIQKVSTDSILDDWIAIANYSILMLLRLKFPEKILMESPTEKLQHMYQEILQEVWNVLKAKNHDYGEAWKQMHASSFVDIILTRVERTRSLIDENQNCWEWFQQESKKNSRIRKYIQDQLVDIINYAGFGWCREYAKGTGK